KFTAVNPEFAEKRGVDTSAVMVDNVIKDEPAAQAGLKDGEIIVSLNGQKLEKLANPAYSVQNFMRQLMKLQDKQQVVLGVKDESGKLRDVTVKFKEMPKTFEEAARLVDQVQGMQIRDRVLPLDLYLNTGAIAEKEGLVVEGVAKGGPAEKVGLAGGDLITEVDGKAVKTVADYKVAVEAKMGKSVKLTIYRGTAKQPVYVTLDIPLPPK
ncbi:MAG: PDZ domain-containing protein, partial [Planctomycetaceae bacterium]